MVVEEVGREMAICEICGEAIAGGAGVCPYCGTRRVGVPERGEVPLIVDIDIERGLPTVREALARLDRLFEAACGRGVRLLRVIHGYGSRTGGHSRIRQAARARMAGWLAVGKIRAMLPGEAYHPGISRESRAWQRRHPVLRGTEVADRRNPGITFLECGGVGCGG